MLHEHTRGLRWLTMQSSTVDANCYDFIESRRERERRSRRWQLANCFPSNETIRAQIVLFHLWPTPLWRRWIFNRDDDRGFPAFRPFPLKASGYIVSLVLSYLGQVCPQVKLSGSIESSLRAFARQFSRMGIDGGVSSWSRIWQKVPYAGKESPEVLPKRDWLGKCKTKEKSPTVVGVSIYRIFLV